MNDKDRSDQHAPFPDYAPHPADIQEALEETVKLCPGCADQIPEHVTICVNCREDQEEREARQ